MRQLEGHEHGVISLSWTHPQDATSKPSLISGSWDGTARVWDLEAGTSTILPGHENGVCVMGLPNGNIVTGSTGVQVDQAVVGYQLRLWQDGKSDLVGTSYAVIGSKSDHEGQSHVVTRSHT